MGLISDANHHLQLLPPIFNANTCGFIGSETANVDVCPESLSNNEDNNTYYINNKNNKIMVENDLIVYTGNRKWIVSKTAYYRY